MDSKKLADYLKKYLSEGYQEEGLKQHLIKNGVSANEIDFSLSILKKEQNKQQKEIAAVNNAPAEITFLSGIYFMFAAMLIIYALMVYMDSNSLPQSQKIREIIGEASYFSFFLLTIGIISAFVGYGILKLKPWAKSEGIMISVAAALTLIGIIITIATFYLFSKQEVKEAFAQSSHLKAEAKELKREAKGFN